VGRYIQATANNSDKT